MSRKYLVAMMTTAGLMSITATAQAQSIAGNPPAAPAAASPDDTVIADIVVTAQKRSENIQRVPISIIAVSGEQLATAGVTTLANLNAIAPGFNSRNTAGAFQPSIRGIGTSSNVVENPVALYIDGVYIPQQREGLRELPDIEQLAVLKGPQGTLFGRNATGGVVQITTRRPTQALEAEARIGFDSFETLRAGAFLSGGLADGLAGSVSIDYAHQGKGWGTNLLTGNGTFQLLHSFSARGKLVWDIGADTTATLIGDYMNRRERAFSFVPYPGTNFVRPPAVKGSVFDTDSPVDPFTAFHGGGVSFQLEHSFGFAKFVSTTSYREGSSSYFFDDIPIGQKVLYVHVEPGGQPNKDYTQEVQLTSRDAGPFKWTVGVFYYHNDLANTPIVRDFSPLFFNNVPPPPASSNTLTYGAERTESVAPYGQLGIELFAGTNLTLGGRWTYEQRTLTQGQVIATRFSGAVVTTNFTPVPLTIKKPTWRIALDHQFSPTILGYASYNRGIKSGGFNVLNPANPAYLPEQLDAYEAGLKMDLLDRHLRLNVGGFYYDYNNLQVTQFVGTAQAIVNGAKARLYGVDVDFTARVTPELTLTGGLEAMHATFTQYSNAVGTTPNAFGATVFPIDAAGKRVPQAQNFVGNLALDYETPVSFGSLHFNANASYNGDYYFESDNFLRQPAYVLAGTSLAWTSTDKHYTISVWARNLLDEKVIYNASSQAPGYPVSYGGQAPRSVGITGKVNF
ncbi:MAG: hypothetical protein JWL96_4197 [Sphingomonas bacterium]|uniref:TonB-dependent receptor n=1 Tax=Sphingomonas bacterium TaxID=1895847 RepID=UPI00260C9098|nr:TonB-dependent receptor [Sphingomonas bacterium]MDB5712127.1 hypothetical protein [Sphingomonas bacterium]